MDGEREPQSSREGANDPMRKLLHSMSEQLAQLVRHVAEVRRTTRGIDERLTAVQDDVSQLKVDVAGLKAEIGETREDLSRLMRETSDYLSGKIDHFIRHSTRESAETRAILEAEKYERRAEHQKLVERVERIEQRVF